jgi:hypothetical protein
MGLRTSVVAGAFAIILSITSFVTSISQVAIVSATASIFLEIALALCYAAFIHGFAVIGRRESNSLLMVTSYTLICIVTANIAIVLGVHVALGNSSLATIIFGAVIVCRSSVELLLGTLLWKMRRTFGGIGLWTAITAIFLGLAGFLLGNLDFVRIPFLLCGCWLFIAAANPRLGESGTAVAH